MHVAALGYAYCPNQTDNITAMFSIVAILYGCQSSVEGRGYFWFWANFLLQQLMKVEDVLACAD